MEIEAEVCPICWSVMKKGEARFITDCNHCFHYACLKASVTTALSCPVCRRESSPSRLPSAIAAPATPMAPIPQMTPTTPMAPEILSRLHDFAVTPRALFCDSPKDEPLPPVSEEAAILPNPEETTSNILLSIASEFRVYPPSGAELAGVVSLEGTGAKKRKYVDLVFVVDTSGSMEGRKMSAVRRSLKFVLTLMCPSDRFCLVSFCDAAQQLTPLSCVSPVNLPRLTEAIDNLYAEGSTNIYSGICCAARALASRSQRNPVSCIALLTDGQERADRANLVNFCPRRLGLLDVEGQAATSLYTFGFGSDHDAALLGTLAEKRGGSFCYIPGPSEVPAAFGGFLGGITSVCAQKIIMELTSLGRSDSLEVATRYSSKREGCSIIVSLPDLLCGERRDIPFSIRLPVQRVFAERETVLDVCVRVSGQVAVCRQLTIVYSAEPQGEPNPLVIDQGNRWVAALAFSEAARLAGEGKPQEACRSLRGAAEKIRSSGDVKSAFSLRLLADLEDVEKALLSPESSAIPLSTQMSQAHFSQRAVALGPYSTTNQILCATQGESIC